LRHALIEGDATLAMTLYMGEEPAVASPSAGLSPRSGDRAVQPGTEGFA